MAQKCVHQSCGKMYTDPEEECQFHPGPPIFHEGQKGWKCCKPRVLTFDEFLSIPPCSTGRHSTTDLPPTIEKKETPSSDTPTLKPVDPSPTPAPRAPVPTAQAASATPLPAPVPESEDDEPSLQIPKGKICRRKACGQSYEGGDREGEKCVHHPGAPIFHEGSKGYTCCKRRVLEFDEFMKIEGCKTKERHLFVGSGKKKGMSDGGEEVLETVRHDFYQTPTTLIASFFLKKISKDSASVSFLPQSLDLNLVTTDTPPKRYKTSIPLFGPIDTEKSAFKILGTKLEVTFVKKDGASWPVLRSDEQRTGEIIQVGKAGRVL